MKRSALIFSIAAVLVLLIAITLSSRHPVNAAGGVEYKVVNTGKSTASPEELQALLNAYSAQINSPLCAQINPA